MDKREQLMAKYPEILGDVQLGFGGPDGWLPIIDQLCEKLMQTPNPPKAVQIKEKFGGLRFYVDYSTKEQNDLIWWAEGESQKTCERCGAPGKLIDGGWRRTLCDEHAG